MAKHILIVLTSHDTLGDTGEKTGFWLEELAAPYYALKDAGVDITLATPKGGQPPLDPKSDAEDAQTDDTRRFKEDAEAKEALANTKKLADVSAQDFDAVFYPGGHGPLWDLVSDQHSLQLIHDFLAAEKPVAAVCHAPIALINAKGPDGKPVVANKSVTGFANSEEDAVGLTGVVPMLVEDALKEMGGTYRKGNDWESFVQADGLLITGQNPASSRATAEALLSAL